MKADRLPVAGMLLCAALAAPAAAERLPLRLFNSANGFDRDLVLVVRQDSRGVFWFGTDGGISRYDGTAVRNYGRAEGVPEGWVSDILETGDGTLLFATAGGVCRLAEPVAAERSPPPRDRAFFTCAAPLGDPSASDVRALHEDRRGRFWVGTAAGLYRLDRRPDGWKFAPEPIAADPETPAASAIRAMVGDRDGGLWIATAAGLAHRSEDGRVARYDVVPPGTSDPRLFSLLLDAQARLWIGHVDDGLFVWTPPAAFVAPPGWSIAGTAAASSSARQPNGAIRLPQSPGEAIRIGRREGLDDERVRTGLLEDRDGAIWIGTVRGLARFRDGRIDRFGRANGLPDDGMRPSLVDRSGNLWFGSPSGGAARLRRTGFTTFDESDGLLGFRVRSIREGRDGALYVHSAADRDFVLRFDGERFAAVAPRPPNGTAFFGWWNGQIGVEDRQGDWWLPTGRDGLLRWARPRRFSDLAAAAPRAHYRKSDGLGSDATQVLYEDRQGDLWIGAFAAPYLAVWRRATARFESFDRRAGLPQDAPTVFAEDASGRLWIGFGDGSLGYLHDRRLVALDRRRLPAWRAVYDLHFDASGRLWVASSGGGLVRLDEPAAPATPIRVYAVAEGLASADIGCLAEDAQGRIYAGSDRGIDRLDPATGGLHHFSSADGLANNVVRAAFRDRQGDLWFGTMQGLSRLRPEGEEVTLTPATLLTEVEIAGLPQPLPETGATAVGPLRLPVGADRIRMAFVAPSGDLDFEPAYRYRLAGLEDAWSAPGRDRAVTYAGLRPGAYRFVVAAMLPSGETGSPATLEFTLPPPLWRRWWALTVFALLPIAAAYLLHRQRLGRLLAVERVRTRIAADLHDDLGASLSRIAVLSEVAYRRGAGEGAHELVEIAETARQLTDEASDMVWSIDPRQDDLASLLARLRRLAGDLLGERGIELRWSAPADAGAIHLAADQRRHLLLILKEAIHNAARHAAARTIAVHVEATRHRIRAAVRDDGKGFDPGAPQPSAGGGRGLANLEQRARDLGGALAVRSAPGAGTSVTLEMPR